MTKVAFSETGVAFAVIILAEYSVKNKFFTRKFVPAAPNLQALEGMGY